jgi:hypothetical protein
VVTHATAAEGARLQSLLHLLSPGRALLDVGGREGWIADHARARFARRITVDVCRDDVHRPTVQATIARLPFRDGEFDTVLCAEVLEHVPPPLLPQAVSELARVTRTSLVVGVPFDQDLRQGQWTCRACGAVNPAYGHVNRFTADSLCALFPTMVAAHVETVWPQPTPIASPLALTLMKLARHPYGTYTQLEGCLDCGRPPEPPPLTLHARVLARGAWYFTKSVVRPTWLHVQFARPQ